MDQDPGSMHESLLQFVYMAPVGLVRIDNGGVIGMVNPVCAKLLLPISVNGALANLFDILEPYDPEIRCMAAARPMQRGAVCLDRRVNIAPCEGRHPRLQVLAISLIRVDPDCLMATLSDVTESAQREILVRETELANESLRLARDAAESASRMKSEFLANMSHELRTPMHAITSFSRMGLLRIADLPREKLQRYLQNIDASATRLNGLLNDLLDLAKIEAGKMRYDFAEGDILALLRASVGEFEVMASQRDVALRIDFASPRALAVVDGTRMRQVFANLLSNAIKFSPTGGVVEVRAALTADAGDGACVVVSIADQGPGVPGAELEMIFEKFVQSSKTSTGAGGTGLGLSIVREILAAHAGRVRVANRSGGGAEFIVEVPACRQAQPVPAQ